MRPEFTGSQTWIRLSGKAIPGAEDRQQKIPGWDQVAYSRARVFCIGAGGLISHIAPTLVRKGIGGIVLLDPDIVEPSNLNRQRFYTKDIGHNKALALAENLRPECIAETEIVGIPMRLEDAIARRVDLSCDLAICGVDNNPARIAASRFCRLSKISVIFSAVSLGADHGYVFVQERDAACIGCLFPDIVNDDRFPCPGTPAIADILQAMGALAVYAADTLIMSRPRAWNYRRFGLADGSTDGSSLIPVRERCSLCVRGAARNEENPNG
jgi:molybdopterin/thiamine biosynthesis adenylyltransferase